MVIPKKKTGLINILIPENLRDDEVALFSIKFKGESGAGNNLFLIIGIAVGVDILIAVIAIGTYSYKKKKLELN